MLELDTSEKSTENICREHIPDSFGVLKKKEPSMETCVNINQSDSSELKDAKKCVK